MADEQHHSVWVVSAAVVAVDRTVAVGIAGMIVGADVRNWWQQGSKSLRPAAWCLGEVRRSWAAHEP